MANKHNSTTHSRAYIINTMFDDFHQLISDETIEASLIKLGIISAVTRSWLKEHFIDKQLSAKECAELLGCSIGHVQKKIQGYNLNKKTFGITNGNNQAHRRMVWKRNIQNAQPNRKEVIVFHSDSDTPLFECPSIVETSRKLKLAREHVRDCLNPSKKRKTAGGFKFMFKKVYDEQQRISNAFKSSPIPTITSKTSLEDMIAIVKRSA